MHVTLVHVHVLTAHIADFIAATNENQIHACKESGNLRFDVLQQADDPSSFVLYEAYDTTEAAAAHKLTPHYLKWRDIVGSWMATSRRGVIYHDTATTVSKR